MPSGKIYRVGDDVPVAEPMVVASTGPRTGEQVYTTKCSMCHASGLAGAPKAGDAAAWADRLAKGEEALMNSGIQGVPGTGMAAKGGCSDCSNDEVKDAVKHLLDMLN